MTYSIKKRIAFCVGCLIFISNYAQSHKSDSYTITFNEQNPELVEVTAVITLEDNILRMSRLGPMPDRWAEYIQDLNAKTWEGKPLNVQLKDSVQWVLSGAKPSQTVRLNYQLKVEHESVPWPGGIDGVAFVRPWGVMLSGRSVFVMNGKDKSNIKVLFELPESWKISAPWQSEHGSTNQFIVNNYTQLQESLLFAGTHEEVVIPKGDFSLKFVLGGDKILERKSEYISNARKVLDYYIDLMGGNPIPGPGDELSVAMVMLNESEQLDGEVIGNHLSMFINPDGDMQSQMIGWFMFAHEFFHLWNGKTLRYHDTTTDWFKEGISNYYTLKALNQVGVANEEVTKMILNNLFYQRYVNDPGYGTLTPAEAASGFDKDNHWGLVYGGGLFAGVCIDMEIRKNSGNETSLDDVMRALYVDFGGKDKLIDSETLRTTFNDYGRTDFTAFIENYVHGNKSVPLHNYLKYAGVKVTYPEGQLVLEDDPAITDKQQELWRGFLGEN